MLARKELIAQKGPATTHHVTEEHTRLIQLINALLAMLEVIALTRATIPSPVSQAITVLVAVNSKFLVRLEHSAQALAGLHYKTKHVSFVRLVLIVTKLVY